MSQITQLVLTPSSVIPDILPRCSSKCSTTTYSSFPNTLRTLEWFRSKWQKKTFLKALGYFWAKWLFLIIFPNEVIGSLWLRKTPNVLHEPAWKFLWIRNWILILKSILERKNKTRLCFINRSLLLRLKQ